MHERRGAHQRLRGDAAGAGAVGGAAQPDQGHLARQAGPHRGGRAASRDDVLGKCGQGAPLPGHFGFGSRNLSKPCVRCHFHVLAALARSRTRTLDWHVASIARRGSGPRSHQQECGEEAGIPPELAATAVAAGAVSYTALQPAGVKRDVLFVYDLRLPAEFTPTPQVLLHPSCCTYAICLELTSIRTTMSCALCTLISRSACLEGHEPALGKLQQRAL